MDRYALLDWLLPGCEPATASIMYPTPAGEQPGWVNTAADAERAVAAYRRGTLSGESFESVTKDGRPYRIFAGSRLGLVPHRDGLVMRFCFDFDDHGGDG